MGTAIKCDVCGKLEECKKFVAVELWEHETGYITSNEQLEKVDVCKKCLKDVKKLLKLGKKRKKK